MYPSFDLVLPFQPYRYPSKMKSNFQKRYSLHHFTETTKGWKQCPLADELFNMLWDPHQC